MDIAERMAAQQAYFGTGVTRDLSFRREKLLLLAEGLKRHEDALLEALRADLGKTSFEGYMTELGLLHGEVRHAIAMLSNTTKPKRARSTMSSFPSSSHVYRDPFGVVAIIAPWNYPLQLTIMPLIGALAAGNCAVVKPSKDAPHMAEAIATLIAECFMPEYVSCFQGDRHVNQAILHGPCDFIFFTGSPTVGREVMRIAAERLVPVVLELGGKSPCIVLEDADMALAARRILWGKLINAGQTCVAPDYLLVHRRAEKPLLDAMAKALPAMFTSQPLLNPEYPHIVNERHFDRLLGYLGDGRIALGGQYERETLRIAPTILTDILPDAPVMREEIFGPILPVVPFDTWEDALAQIARHPLPLACYLFTKDRRAGLERLEHMRFGSGCLNDCVLQLANPHLPFGGVGNSGMGCYHGRYSIDCFSRPKGVLSASTRFDMPIRYAPYAGKLNLLRRFVR